MVNFSITLPQDTMRTVSITAHSRLHFGMFSFGNPLVRQYGGVGVMLEKPQLKLILEPTSQFSIKLDITPSLTESSKTELKTRINQTIQHLIKKEKLAQFPNCKIRIVKSFPQHAGLGSGTQLALAVVKSVLCFCDSEVNSLEELVSLANRGKRSAVGSYGFEQGGFIIDSGKVPGETLAPLKVRTNFPTSWHWVLIQLNQSGLDHSDLAYSAGLSGSTEKMAFEQIPSVPKSTTAVLEKKAFEQILPAVQSSNFERFSENLYFFGALAGSCFAAIQGGTFASAEIENAINKIRSWGISGVGQSSWGPTIFVITPNIQAANDLIDRMHQDEELKLANTQITTATNQPAQVVIDEH